MNAITLDKIVHRDRVYHLREPITIAIEIKPAYITASWRCDAHGHVVECVVPRLRTESVTDDDLSGLLREFGFRFDRATRMTTSSFHWSEQPPAEAERILAIVRRIRSHVDRTIDGETDWAASVIAANRERGGVAAIHGQVPAEESNEAFVRQVTERDARDRRERAMMRLLLDAGEQALCGEPWNAKIAKFFRRQEDEITLVGGVFESDDAAVEAAIAEEIERE